VLLFGRAASFGGGTAAAAASMAALRASRPSVASLGRSAAFTFAIAAARFASTSAA
jgi:hypothetical protein